MAVDEHLAVDSQEAALVVAERDSLPVVELS
jgi:hypothetical protein